MKRFHALALTLALLAGTMAGCATGAREGAPPADTGSTGSPAAEGAGGDVVILTAFKDGPVNPPEWTWGQDPSSRRITEITGVQIEVSYATTGDHTELMTMLAAGDNLPDFIITPSTESGRNLLVNQGFALPLNELADEYDPSFWEVLPKDMDKVYQEPDGNFYCVVDWYGDENKYDDQLLNTRGPVSVSIKQEYYEEVGRPQIDTLDQYIEVIRQIQALHPDINHGTWEMYGDQPWNNSSLINLLARMYGATNSYFHWEGDSLEMVFKQDYYKDALRMYNRFYREGILNPEVFTYKLEQRKGVYNAQDLISFVGYYWNIMEGMDILQDVVYETIEYPMPAGRDSSQLKIHDDYFGVGDLGTFITKDTQHPELAIKYLTFMLGLEGQLIQRYGVEGVTWEPDELGRPKENAAKVEAENRGFEILQREMGVYNYNFSWLTSNWILVYGAHNTYQNFPCMLPDFAIMTPHQQNERFSDLTYALTDPDGMVLKSQIFDIWSSGVAGICVADTDQAFEAAYDKFIGDMQSIGVEQLEAYFQQNADHWVSVGLSN